MYNRGEHGNGELSVDEMIAAMIPDMERKMLAEHRAIIGDSDRIDAYHDAMRDIADEMAAEHDLACEHNIRAELLTASVNWIVGKSLRLA